MQLTFVAHLYQSCFESSEVRAYNSLTFNELAFETDSLVATRVRILSVRPIVADLAGTKLTLSATYLSFQVEHYLPMCAMNVIKATCFKYTLLPE
jgi:hypothetical protein